MKEKSGRKTLEGEVHSGRGTVDANENCVCSVWCIRLALCRCVAFCLFIRGGSCLWWCGPTSCFPDCSQLTAHCGIAGVAGARLPDVPSGRDGQRKTSYPSELAVHARSFQCVRELDLLAKRNGGEMGWREMEMEGRWDGDGVVK